MTNNISKGEKILIAGSSGMAGNAMSSSDIKSLVREAISALSDEMHFKGAGALPVLRATGPGNVGLSGTKSKISQHASPDHFNNLSSAYFGISSLSLI